MEPIKPFSVITPEQIQDWKAKKGSLSQIDVQISDMETASFIACKPSRTVMDLLSDKSSKKDVPGFNKSLVSNCLLGGDIDIMESDGGVYSGVLDRLSELTEAKKTSIKNI